MAKENRKKAENRPAPSRASQRTAAQRPLLEPADIWALAFFALVTIIFFSKHLFGSAWLWEDFAEFTYPNEVYAARSFHDGIVPFWNPFTFNGMPFLADLQIGYFYPGNQLMYILSGGKLSSWLAQLIVILHYVVAMVGMWRLAGRLGVGQWGRMLAGVTYALSGMLVAHMIHANMVFHLAWFPLIVHLFHRGVAERSWLHSLLSGLVLGIALLSGHPQSTLYIVFFLFCLTLFLLIRDLRGGTAKGSVVGGALAAALPIAVGVGIFAVQLLPSQELAGLSERAEMSYEKSVEGAMTGGQLLTLVVPKLFGVSDAAPPQEQTIPFWLRPDAAYYYWETAVYIGVVALLLAIVGLFSTRLGPIRWFLGGMALLGLLYGLGDNFFIHPLLSKLPLFGTFRSPVRLAMYLSLGGAILAGAGLDTVLRGEGDRDRIAKIVLIAGGVVVLFGLLTVSGLLPGMLGVPEQIADAIASTGWTAALIGGIAAAVAWGATRGKIAPTVAAIVLLLFAVVDMHVYGAAQNASPNDPQQTYDLLDGQYARFKATPPDSLFRVKMREQTMAMQRNQGPYSGIMLFEGYNPLLLARRVPPAATPEKAYDFMNIRYDLRLDPATGSVSVIDRPSAFPHARMLYDARVGSAEQVLGWLKSTDVDFGKTVLLEKNPGVTLDGTGTGQARITRYDASEIEATVTTDKPGILVLSEVWYPAWKVYLDGKPQELLVADYSLRGVAVPPGNHTVVLRYESDAFGTGKWITIATLVVAIAGIVFLLLRRRGGERETAPAV